MNINFIFYFMTFIISNVNTTDNSSVQNISSSTDTYNVDNSSVVNSTEMNTTNELVQSCGMTIQDAQEAVNIVKDESINTNIDASNTFIVTGNNNTITDVRLETEVNFSGPNVDKSCALDTLNKLSNDLSAENDNTKSMAGGSGGDTGAQAGGNTTENANTSEKKDEVDAGVDAGQDATQAATTTNENTAENKNTNELSTSQSAEQGAEASASASAGFGFGINPLNIIGLVLLVCYFLFFKKININFNTNKKHLILMCILIMLFYKIYFN